MAVYFIQDAATGLVKIGHTNDPWRRLTMLQTGSAGKLSLLAFIDGGEDAEDILHSRFASLRERGEWFRFEREFADYVATLPAAGVRPRKNGAAESWNGHSSEDVARATGISPSFLCEIRKGRRRPSPEKAILIQRATGLSAIKLIFGDLYDEAA